LKNVHVCIKEADLVTSPADKVCAVNCGNQNVLLFTGLAAQMGLAFCWIVFVVLKFACYSSSSTYIS
jgi:hypothetical protein